MKKYVLALGVALAGSSPAFADGLRFEPLVPQGVSADRMAGIEAFQAAIGPDQLAAMEAEAPGSFGAIAIPVAFPGNPVAGAGLADRAAAEEAVLAACKEQTGTECTLIGVFIPEG